jgi:hypothetical protein
MVPGVEAATCSLDPDPVKQVLAKAHRWNLLDFSCQKARKRLEISWRVYMRSVQE